MNAKPQHDPGKWYASKLGAITVDFLSKIPPDFRRQEQGLGGFDREVGGFPSYDAARNFTDVVKSAALQQACADRRPVAACTINEQGTVFGKFSEIFR